MTACALCDEPQVILSMGGLCLGCEADSERRVAKLEAMLEKGRALRHYEAMAVEAAGILGDPPGRGMKRGNPENAETRAVPVGPSHELADVPARLGRPTTRDNAGGQDAAPVVVSAGGGAP